MNFSKFPLTFLSLALILGAFAARAQTTNAAPAVNEPAQPLPTAVLRFDSSDEALAKQGQEIATLLEADLSTSEHALMVEREEIDKVLSEQELGKSGLVSADTA